LQFSSITKIGTTIDPSLPIYDSRIIQLFGIRNSKLIRDYDKRLIAHLEDFEEIKSRIEACLKDQTFVEIVHRCQEIYVASRLPDKRIADLVLWAYHQLEPKNR